MRVRLIRPSLKYFSRFRNSVDDPEDQTTAAAEYLARKQAGEAPEREFWLVDDDSYIGRIRIRQQPSGRKPAVASHIHFEIKVSMRRKGMGTRILALGLKKATSMGIDPVLLTCGATDVACRKIIERNGGELLRVVRVRTHGTSRKICVYAILLRRSPQVVL
jgi:predicted acetyltransferase